VDDDGNFSNGGTTYYTNNDGTGIVISNLSGIVSVSNISGVHIPNNVTRYVTLASYIPQIIACNDINVCAGQSVSLSATGGTTYFWDNSLGAGQTHIITPVTNITYHVTGANVNGCTNTDSVKVTMNTILVTDVQTACESYTWIDGNTYSANNNTATYTYVGGAANGCDSIVALSLIISPNINISLGEDIFFCGESIIVTPGAGYTSYLWNDGSNLPTLVIKSEGSYNVIVTNLEGCSDSSSIEVIEDCPFSIYIPNSFTPDGDKFNDVFKVVGDNLVSIEALIFNRWGELIYSWEDIDGFWDGKNTTRDMSPDGAYTYVVKYGYYYKGKVVYDKKIGHVALLK
jgi:gliding motility-associated-like protein